LRVSLRGSDEWSGCEPHSPGTSGGSSSSVSDCYRPTPLRPGHASRDLPGPAGRCSPLRLPGDARLQSPRPRRELPNWSYSASDFWAWVHELRATGAYDPHSDMARVYWAHFPVATTLGFEAGSQEE
uniref:Otospiralin n=1 Tax=Petromyzon marinus TaxID=7757 RepID=A0AAJ7SKS6_PETMA